MASVGIYLNFTGDAEDAFNFYRRVFGGEFTTLQRMNEIPAGPDQPALSEDEQTKVMHVALPILGGTVLMGTDALESMGQEVTTGNNMTISLEPDSLEETQRLYEALSEGATTSSPLQPMFWGAYWGMCVDRYGVPWMFNSPMEP